MAVKVSVVIPFFNGIQYIEECVRSAMNQTLQDIEIILIDDGSTDGCSEFADAIAKEDERIRVVHQANGGLSCGRNRGIELARGEYIAFLDGDDVVKPEMYETLFNEAQSRNCELVTCGYYSFRNTGSTVKNPPLFPFHQRLSHEDILKMMPEILSNGSLPFVWRRLYKATLFHEKNIRFDEKIRYCEDASFCMECFLKADGVSAIPDELYGYRYVVTSLVRNKKYNPNITFCLLRQYDIKCDLIKAFAEENEKENLCALARNSYAHISGLLFRNLYRNNKKKYREFKTVVKSKLFADMFRYFDINTCKSSSLDWVCFDLIRRRLYPLAYCIGFIVYRNLYYRAKAFLNNKRSK